MSYILDITPYLRIDFMQINLMRQDQLAHQGTVPLVTYIGPQFQLMKRHMQLKLTKKEHVTYFHLHF